MVDKVSSTTHQLCSGYASFSSVNNPSIGMGENLFSSFFYSSCCLQISIIRVFLPFHLTNRNVTFSFILEINLTWSRWVEGTRFSTGLSYIRFHLVFVISVWLCCLQGYTQRIFLWIIGKMKFFMRIGILLVSSGLLCQV